MNPTEQPYSWYAISNAGSFTACCRTHCSSSLHLLSTRKRGFGLRVYLVYAILMLAIIVTSRTTKVEPVSIQDKGRQFRWSWILIPSATSMLLLGATSYMSENIAPIPLTWVIPLAVYLLSFVSAFATLPRFGRGASLVLGASGLLILCVAALDPLLMYRLRIALALVSSGFLLVCISLHRELYLRRPPNVKELTRFYVFIATGGAAGAV